jgi:hypothetical protein
MTALTPFESFVVREFKLKGGVFAVDEDGDLHAVLGGQRCGLYCRSMSAAPFLMFESGTLRTGEFHIVQRALIKAARLERATGQLGRIDTFVHPVVVEEQP